MQNLFSIIYYFSSIVGNNFDGRFGVVVGVLAYYARGRGFDFRTVQVCIGSGCIYVCIYKKRKIIWVFIRYLELLEVIVILS
jgi:hypothetical protein